MVAAIQAAIASLSASLPDASLAMRHGDAEGVVLAVSSRDLSGDTVTADAPQEMRRVVGRSCDFPSVAKGSAVELAGELHVVTSARTDPVGASLTLGLSAPFDNMRISYARRGGKPFPMSVLALEDASAPSAFADATAPLEGQTWTVCIVASQWMETAAPAVGDEMIIFSERTGTDLRLRVASVVADGERWMLRARPRGSA